MTWYGWVIVGILWTIVMVIAGYKSGLDDGRKETKKDAQSSSNFYQTVQSPEVTKADLDGLNERIGLVDQQVQNHTQTHQSPGKGMTLAESHVQNELITRVKALEDRDPIYLERFKRVEKKAGMSV